VGRQACGQEPASQRERTAQGGACNVAHIREVTAVTAQMGHWVAYEQCSAGVTRAHRTAVPIAEACVRVSYLERLRRLHHCEPLAAVTLWRVVGYRVGWNAY
jgi:hypothetical protein